MSQLTFETFTSYVRNCLMHLYDYAFLQDHPLPRLLVPDAAGDATRIQAFRQLIINTIESLNLPQEDVQTKQSRLHGILALRYIQQQTLQSTLVKLNLSERQFYRDHGQAVQVISRLLWEQFMATGTTEPQAGFSVQSELQRLNRQTEPLAVELEPFLQHTLEALDSLCKKHGVEIRLEVSPAVSVIHIDPTLLRQALIWLLSQTIIQIRPNTTFTLTVDLNENHYRFVVRHARQQGTPSYEELVRQETLQTFVAALDGQIKGWTTVDDEIGVSLEIPFRQHSLLIIDDNPEVIALFRRYLNNQPYRLVTAHEGDQALHLARELHPDVIILDVLLPKVDGWEVLRSLKNLPETQDIPVLVCSVLDADELALSLGADGFLKKIPSEEAFVQALTAFTFKLPW